MTLSCPQRLETKKTNYHVFLAGPIQGAPNWQHSIEDADNITFLSPRRTSYDNFNYSEQVSWERDHLLSADIVVFWIPKPIEKIEGRDYAQTTRTEFGEYLARGKKVIFGCYEGFSGERYFQTKLTEYGCGEVLHSLEEVISAVKEQVNEWEANPKMFFTSDTHFGSERAMMLSKRPFRDVRDMDWTMIQRWNDTVHPCDTVYHLGDFGDTSVLKYLNGYIYTIDGNYERDGKSPKPTIEDGIIKNYDDYLILNDEYLLTHEPLNAFEMFKEGAWKKIPVLFGHIHGRQKCKPFGIDVGVDANNFTPMSKEDVDFYLNAINKGYYDKEVWCQ